MTIPFYCLLNRDGLLGKAAEHSGIKRTVMTHRDFVTVKDSQRGTRPQFSTVLLSLHLLSGH